VPGSSDVDIAADFFEKDVTEAFRRLSIDVIKLSINKG
jgi:hypothetical protein